MKYKKVPTLILSFICFFLVVIPARGAGLEWDIFDREAKELYRAGKYDRAVLVAQKALEVAEENFGKEHPYVAVSLNNLAELYRNRGDHFDSKKRGDYFKAKLLYRRALLILENELGSNHPYVGLILNNLAELYRNQGDYADAKPLYRRALAIFENAKTSNHYDVGLVLNNLALLYANQGDYVQAEPFYKRALLILENELGSNHPYVGLTLNNLAELYREKGDYTQAEPLYKRALAIFQDPQPLIARSFPEFAMDIMKKNPNIHPSDLDRLWRLADGKYYYYQLGDKLRLKFNISFGGASILIPEATAAIMDNLAALYRSTKRIRKAKQLEQRAARIRAIAKN